MARVISDFRETVDNATGRLLSISDEQSQLASEEGKWSPKQIIGHLIDSASNNYQRFVRAQFKDDLVFQGYDQEDWVRVQRYDEEPWSMLVQLWSAYNLHLAHVMAKASDENRTRLRDEHNLDQIAWQTVPTTE